MYRKKKKGGEGTLFDQKKVAVTRETPLKNTAAAEKNLHLVVRCNRTDKRGRE